MQKPIHKRKNKHLEICLDPPEPIEPQASRFSEIHILPRAFPEHTRDAVSTQCEFAGRTIALPLLILPMTGGTHQGTQLNRCLVAAAQHCKLPVGLGSMRVMLENEAESQHFIPDTRYDQAIVIANIGAIELKRHSAARIFTCCERLGASVLSLHINVAQEMMQRDGDTEFSALLGAIAQLRAQSPIPILVKETGMGIDPWSVRRLWEMGVDYIDISGSGGSNWALVEALAQKVASSDIQAAFYKQWGISSALLLRVLYHMNSKRSRGGTTGAFFPPHALQGRIIASGGVRSLYDIMACLVSGASYVGMALPMIRLAAEGGEEKLIAYIEELQTGLQSAMLTAGAASIRELQSCVSWCDASLQQEVEQILAAFAEKNGYPYETF